MSVHDETVDLMNENARLQSELAAARKALEEMRSFAARRQNGYAHLSMSIYQGKHIAEELSYVIEQLDNTLAALSSKEPEGERIPKVRTSHRRNAEEASRLQNLVNEKYTALKSEGR